MRARYLLLFAFLLSAAMPTVQAQLAAVPYVGYDLDAENVLLGLGVEFALPVVAPVALNVRPSGEYVLIKDIDIAGRTFSQSVSQVNLDVIARLKAPGIQPYGGVGVGVRFVSLDTSDNDAVEGDQDVSETNVGANLLGGVLLGGIGPVRPFVQGRVTVGDGSALSVMGGVRVGL